MSGGGLRHVRYGSLAFPRCATRLGRVAGVPFGCERAAIAPKTPFPSFPTANLTIRALSTQAAQEQPETPSPPKASKKYVHFVNTLNPKNLTSRDYLDLSGKSSSDVFLTTRNTNTFSGTTLTSGMPIESKEFPPTTYPAGTAGFFYLYIPPLGAPAAAAALRFRITNDANPASFSQGTDRMFDGLPWNRPAPWLYMPFFRSLASQDGVPSKKVQNQVDKLHNFLRHSDNASSLFSLWRRSLSLLLYSRSQPFALHLDVIRARFWLLTETQGECTLTEFWHYAPHVRRTIVDPAVLDARKRSTRPERTPSPYYPLYTGKIIARFEWLTTEAGLRTVMRILKVVEPIEPLDPSFDLPELQEGSLMPSFDPETGRVDCKWELPGQIVVEGSKYPWMMLYNLPDIPVHTEFS